MASEHATCIRTSAHATCSMASEHATCSMASEHATCSMASEHAFHWPPKCLELICPTRCWKLGILSFISTQTQVWDFLIYKEFLQCVQNDLPTTQRKTQLHCELLFSGIKYVFDVYVPRDSRQSSEQGGHVVRNIRF